MFKINYFSPLGIVTSNIKQGVLLFIGLSFPYCDPDTILMVELFNFNIGNYELFTYNVLGYSNLNFSSSFIHNYIPLHTI